MRRTRAAIVKPGTPDRSRRRARRAICGTPGDGQSRARDRLGDFEHLAASLFAFSARFEICRDDRIVGRGKGPNSGRERDSLIRAKLSLIALLAGKIQGISPIRGLVAPRRQRKWARNQFLTGQFPTHRNREFFAALQGIKSGDQGSFRRDQGIPPSSAIWRSPPGDKSDR